MKKLILFCIASLLILFLWFINRYSSIFLTMFVVFILYFFRDPNREINTDERLILSPADGRVLGVIEEEDLEHKKKQIKIDIFLSLLDVHVIRFPISGTISKIQYNKGSFLNALNKNAVVRNENVVLNIVNDKNQATVRMIAGFFARRIVCYRNTGEHARMGEKLGRIIFGSRVQLCIPIDKIGCLKVKEGDRVKAGLSVLGYLHFEP